MKQIILGVLTLFSINVYAETFYTDYTLISENNLEFKEEYINDELKKVEKKIAYNNYKEVRNNENYYELGLAPSNLTYIEQDDYINKDAFNNEPYKSNEEVYETLRITTYQSARFLVLRSFRCKSFLKNIEITYDGSIINHTIYKTNYDFNHTLTSKHNIVLDLGQKYDLSKLIIKLVFEDSTLNELRFILDVYDTDYYSETNTRAYYHNEVYRFNDTEKLIINFINSNEFNNLLPNMPWVNKREYNSINSVSYFKKKIYLYKYYSLIKEYSNIYTTKPLKGYTLDYNSSVYLYDYYQRNYIEVANELNNFNDLTRAIISSSIPINEIELKIKNISNDDTLLIIKTGNNVFYKNIKIKANLESDEINTNSKIVNNQNSTNINEIIIKDQDLTNTQNMTSNEIINSWIKLDEDKVIEKDFSTNKETNQVYNFPNPNEHNNQKTSNDTIAVLLPDEENQKIVNNKSRINIKIIVIILIICVKLLSLFKKKKSFFVEGV